MAEVYAVERRKFALEKAMEMNRSYTNYNADKIVADAKCFEAYLIGKDDSENA